MTNTILLGTHVSVHGGIHTAFERGMKIGCATMQVFTKNSNRWKAKTLTEEDIEKYKTARANATIHPVFAHASYLINLCATSPPTLAQSRSAFAEELRRCAALGLEGLIVHPGSHLGAGEPDGIRRIADSINLAHEQTPGLSVRTLLETTAGQGTAIGYRFEHLRDVFEHIDDRERVAICIDTCHLFASGYPIDTPEGWERTLHELQDTVGLSRLAAVHVNDSRRELGSRIDRHEHIGKGKIGLASFAFLMNDSRFAAIPKILETDKSEDMHEDVENMALLRSLVRTGTQMSGKNGEIRKRPDTQEFKDRPMEADRRTS